MNADESWTLRFDVAPMRLDEIEAVAGLVRDVIQTCDYYNDWAKRTEIEKYDAAGLQVLIEDDPGSVLVARTAARPVGFCINDVDSGLIWLSWIGVAGEFRGRGAASGILSELIARARDRGCHKIWCDSRMSNVESAGMLRRAGFRQICELPNHWCGQDFFLWERLL